MKNAIPPLPRSLWPERYAQQWIAALSTGDFLEPGGIAASWRKATVDSVERGGGIWLAWLLQTGRLKAWQAPGDCMDPDLLREFLAFYSPGRAELTVASTVRNIAYFLRATVTDFSTDWLTRLAHRMVNRATPSRPKTPRMARVPELLALGEKLMVAGQEGLAARCISGAQVFRDGLMVAALAVRPLRRRNLCGLAIGKTFHCTSTVYTVSFTGQETKNRRSLSFPYPEWLTPLFDYYIGQARPILLSRGETNCTALWVGRRGRPMAETDVSHRIAALTTKHLGRSISPHLFRDCAATDIAVEAPEHVMISKSILGHATLRTAEKFYNQAGSISAARRFHSTIDRLRASPP